MSGILLNISSNSLSGNETTSNFTQPIPNLILWKNFKCALESCSIWYSWFNISADYGNQSFRYNNGSTWKTITITPGLYALRDINTYIQAQMEINGDYTVGSPNIYYIALTPDFNTFKCLLTISNSYQVDFSV